MKGPCKEWNREYIAAHPKSFLATCLHIFHGGSQSFVDTCCEITARAYLWKHGVEDDDLAVAEFGSIREAARSGGLVLAEVDEGEHWFVLHEGMVVESFFKKRAPRRFEIDANFEHEYKTAEIVYYVKKTNT